MDFKKLINAVKTAVLLPTVAETELQFNNGDGKKVITLIDCFTPRDRFPTAVIRYQGRTRLVNVLFEDEVNLSDDGKRSAMHCAIKELLHRYDTEATLLCLGAKGIQVSGNKGACRCMVGGKNVVTFHNLFDNVGYDETHVVAKTQIDETTVTLVSHLPIDESALLSLGSRFKSVYTSAAA